jgi:hypothetical protein
MRRIVAIVGITFLVIAVITSLLQIRKRDRLLVVSNLKQETLALQLSLTNREFGKHVFLNNCRTCHPAPGMLHYNLDNALRGMGTSYFYQYITKQDSLILAKDKYALELKEIYSHMGNSHNFKFSRAELDALIRYIK